MIKFSVEEIENLSKEYSVVPIYEEIFSDIITPIQALKKIKNISKKSYLLESVESGEKWGRYSFIGFAPITEIKYQDNILEIFDNSYEKKETKDINNEIRKILSNYRSPKLDNLPPFTGGFVGYFASDFVGVFSQINLMLFDKVIAFDNLKQKITIIINVKLDIYEKNYEKAVNEIKEIINLFKNNDFNGVFNGKLQSDYTYSINKDDFFKKSEKIKESIRNGEILYDTIIDNHEAEFKGSLFNSYRVLRTSMPSSYMFYIDFDGYEIIGSSPLTLIKLKSRNLTSFISSGSISRNSLNLDIDDKQDEENLLNNENEVSKHNLLIDVVSNDFAKVSKSGSIKIQDYKKIERNTLSINITSQINSQLKNDLDIFDVISSYIPVSIFNRKSQLNNIYAGAIGYIDFTGNGDFCVAINMAISKNNKVYIGSYSNIFINDNIEKNYTNYESNINLIKEAINIAGGIKE